MEKTIFTLKKIIISWVNDRTLHVKQPDVASGVRPETKPPLREPNNYIKRASPLFSSFSVVWPTQFFGIIKKQRKMKRQSWSFFTLINSFNFKDEHYNNISRHKRFGGVSILIWNRPSYFSPYWVCFDLVTMSCLVCVTGAWKWWAQETTGSARETRVSPRAHVLYWALLRSACYTAICLVVFKLHHREVTLLFVNCTCKLNER